ncbi:hypothetical protein ACQKLG_05930 [Pedobacter suwonensis]
MVAILALTFEDGHTQSTLILFIYLVIPNKVVGQRWDSFIGLG